MNRKVAVGQVLVSNGAQSTWSGFIVNIGLLLMLLIDYGYDKKFIPRWSLFLSVIAFGVIALVYYFAGHAVQVQGFNTPFNWPWFGVLLYGMFVVYLMVIKYQSLPRVNNSQKIVESY